MSLLQKASIITTPTAYAEDYLYSIKPAYALGENLDVIPSSDSAVGNHYKFTPYGNNTVQYVNGETIITYVDNGNGAFHYFQTGYNLSQNLTVGKYYKVEITFKINTGSINLQYSVGGSTVNLGSHNNTDYKTVSYSYTTLSATVSWIRFIGLGSSQVVTVRKITIQEATDADFDFDRNSTGTRVNEDYLIEDVPYNLVSQSNQFDTTWTLFHGGTVTGGQPDKDYGNNAWKLNAVSTQSFSGIHQARTFTGVTTASIFAKAGTLSHLGIVNFNGTGFAVWFNLSNGTIGTKDASVSNANMQNLGDGWYRCSFTQDVSAAGYFQLKPSDGELTPSTTSGFVYIQDAQLVKGDQPKDYLKTTDRLDIPRIDYTNGEPSILLEPSRTNLIHYSNDFSDSDWIKQSGISSTYNTTETLSPEGLNNASKFTGNGTNGVYRQVIVTGVVARSIYLKSVTGNVSVTIKDPVLTQTTKTLNLNETWQRFELIESNGHSSASGIWIDDIPASGIYMYGAQLEAGSYATSLIHTSGSAVTRSADVANNAGNSDLISSTEGVLYIERKSLADDLTFKNISLSDGTTPNSIRIYTNNISNSMVFLFFVSGVAQASYTHLFDDITEFHKVAFKYKANDFSIFVDGREVHTDTSGSVLSADTLNSLQFDSGAGGEDFYGNCKMVAVFKEALSDEELECLTGYNNHELYMNYYNRLSYLGLAEKYNVESDINNYIL